MEIKIIREQVKDLDVGHLRDISLNRNDWLPAGQSEYKLYAYLSTFFNKSTILDIGTRVGGSALALSYNPTNQVISYDLVPVLRPRLQLVYLYVKPKEVLLNLN